MIDAIAKVGNKQVLFVSTFCRSTKSVELSMSAHPQGSNISYEGYMKYWDKLDSEMDSEYAPYFEDKSVLSSSDIKELRVQFHSWVRYHLNRGLTVEFWPTSESRLTATKYMLRGLKGIRQTVLTDAIIISKEGE